MIIFFSTFLIVFSTLLFLSKKYENPYKLIMVFGKKGAGKTTYFQKLAIKYNKQGRKVYSDSPIYGTYRFKLEDIGVKLFDPGSVILIDEVSLIWSNRDFKTFKKEVEAFFRYQRHYQLTVILASQTFDIDKKIRDLCDEMYLLTCVFNVFSLARKIDKHITIHNANDENDGESFLTETYAFGPIWDWHLTFIPRYKFFFNSFSIPDMPIVRATKFKYSSEYWLGVLSTNRGYYTYLVATLYQTLEPRFKVLSDKVREKLKRGKPNGSEVSISIRDLEFYGCI